jgi:hypothetical protein
LGFKKVLKVYGVYLLTEVIYILIVMVFAVGYVLLSGRVTSYEDIQASVNSFMESWTYYCAGALASFTILFKYGYVFCVFQEIRNKEAGDASIGLLSAGEGETIRR